MSVHERVARAWHEGSDHAADGTPFGGPLCNCWRVAGRMLPMLNEAWLDGFVACHDWIKRDGCRTPEPTSPYEAEEDS